MTLDPDRRFASIAHGPVAPILDEPGDAALVARLRAGEPGAFEGLVGRHGASMLRVAQAAVDDRAVAEEVVQETWLRILQALDGFEGRSSLRTWMFTILWNTARRAAERERRSIPVASWGDDPPAGPFLDASHPRWGGTWASVVDGWRWLPEQRLLGGELRGVVRAAIAELPPAQRAVIALRDVEGWRAEEVCELLELTDANQRVLLHRARQRVRAAVERYLGAAG